MEILTEYYIKPTRAALRNFPDLKGRKCTLVRWNRNDTNCIMVKVEGRKSLQKYHHKYFSL